MGVGDQFEEMKKKKCIRMIIHNNKRMSGVARVCGRVCANTIHDILQFSRYHR